MEMVGDSTWLTVSETAARLEGLVSDQTVRRLCDEGVLDAIRIGGTRNDRRIRSSSVDAYRARMRDAAIPDEPEA